MNKADDDVSRCCSLQAKKGTAMLTQLLRLLRAAAESYASFLFYLLVDLRRARVQETCDCAHSVVIVWTHDGLRTVVPLDATGAYKDKSKCVSALQIISKPKSVTSVTLRRNESYSLRLDELLIKDSNFLHGQDLPTLAVLYEDNDQKKHVKTYVINLKDKELQKGPWSQPNVEPGASFLHSLPRMARTQPIRSCHYATSICVEIFAGTCGGVLVFEDQSIAHFKGDPKVRFNVVDCKR